jgi:hypothetical protein
MLSAGEKFSTGVVLNVVVSVSVDKPVVVVEVPSAVEVSAEAFVRLPSIVDVSLEAVTVVVALVIVVVESVSSGTEEVGTG